MKRNLLLYLLLCLVLAGRAQDSVLVATDTIKTYPDTIKMQDMVHQLTEDDLLLYLIGQQSRELAAKEDSMYQLRLITDTTTAFPFHIGLRDSLRMDNYAKTMYQTNPMLMPIYYIELNDTNLIKNTDEVISSSDSLDLIFRQNKIRTELQTNIRRYISLYHPELYSGVYDPELISDIHHNTIQTDITPIRIHKSLIRDGEEDRLDRIRDLRNSYSHWYREATTTLHVSQNFVSSNWYAGGSSSFSTLGMLQGKIFYNNRRNITWENTGEWRFGFNTVTGDTLRKINTNEDLFRLYSKFGIKIVDKLNGSISAEFQTQFFNTWVENSKKLKTGPLTPARLNIALGVDYKPVKKLSILFAPLTYRMIGVLDTIHVAQTSFSIESGSKILSELGSSLRVEWRWKPVREFSLDTKFYLYSNYRRVEIDMEVAADFIINRFLSARILLHPRYDNTVILPADEKAKLQFKELVSLGFSHKFH